MVTSAALYLANAGEEQIPQIASEVYGRALGRIGRDVRTALELVRSSDSGERMNAYRSARNLVRQAVDREGRAVDSVSVLAGDRNGKAPLVATLIQSLEQRESDWLRLVDEMYLAASGGDRLPGTERGAREQELSRRVPKKAGTVGEYILASMKIEGVSNLHPLMQFEILNFVDGKRSVLEIFDAVHAESLSVGAFYYGTVTLDAVESYLRNAQTAKAITFE